MQMVGEFRAMIRQWVVDALAERLRQRGNGYYHRIQQHSRHSEVTSSQL
jgi:hypothetical protein